MGFVGVRQRVVQNLGRLLTITGCFFLFPKTPAQQTCSNPYRPPGTQMKLSFPHSNPCSHPYTNPNNNSCSNPKP